MAKDTVKVYLPLIFVNDAKECNEDLHVLWERIMSAPVIRRGRGSGYNVDLSLEEARAIRDEATYRAEYWLTDAYGVDGVTSHERTAGRAARRTAENLTNAIAAKEQS